MIILLVYFLCFTAMVVAGNTESLPLYFWVFLGGSVFSCLLRTLGQWNSARRTLFILAALELLGIILATIIAGVDRDALFLLGTLVFVDQGHRLSANWGLWAGLVCATVVAICDLMGIGRLDSLIGLELAFWPLGGALQWRFFAPNFSSDMSNRVLGWDYSANISAMSETEIIEMLNTRQVRMKGLLDLFRQLELERDMDKLKDSVVQFALEATNSESVALFLKKDDKLAIVASRGEGIVVENNDRGDLNIAINILKTGKPYTFQGDEFKPYCRVPWLDHEVNSYIAVPMIDTLDNVPIGILAIANEQTIGEYDSDCEEFLTVLASLTGVTLNNHILFYKLNESYKDFVKALMRLIESKDDMAKGQVLRVVNDSMALAKVLGLSNDEIDKIAKAAILHDIGKMALADDLLRKVGPLTAKEFALLKSHTIKAKEILEDISSIPKDVMDMIVHHHERYDGKGYPDQLKAENISLGARIISIADAFEGMTCDRPYRKGMSWDKALNEIKEGAGKQFDPRLVPLFIQIKRDNQISSESK